MPNNIFARGTVMEADVRGLREAQQGLQQLQANTSPDGMRGRVQLAIGQLHRYASAIVHVLTGRLKNSLFMDIETAGNDVIGYVATNVNYAPIEDARGGDHAFFGRTVAEEGPRIVNDLFRQVTDV